MHNIAFLQCAICHTDGCLFQANEERGPNYHGQLKQSVIQLKYMYQCNGNFDCNTKDNKSRLGKFN